MKTIHIIGVPLDLGGGRRGVDMGPSAMRIAGLGEQIASLGHTVVDRGDLPSPIPETLGLRDEHKKYIRDIAKVCQKVYQTSLGSLDEGAMPLVLGGDHSIGAGSVAAAAEWARRTKDLPIGLLWVDAHGDMNTPATSLSGNVHGMPLSAVMGYGIEELHDLFGFKPKVEPQNVVLVGVRDLDTHEKKFIKKLGVKAFTMRDIDERGMREVMSDALKYAMDDTDGIAISLDMDFVDPADAPGVGTPVRGGVTYREAHLAMEMIADSEAMVSMEIVEINPVIDEHNRTALLAVELALSGLGKKIL